MGNKLSDKIKAMRVYRPDEWTMDEFLRDASLLEANLEQSKSELDTLSTRFTALMQQNNTLAAENERLNQKLAAMESQEPIYQIKRGEEREWHDTNASHFEICERLHDVETRKVFLQQVPADKPAVAVPAKSEKVRKELSHASVYLYEYVESLEIALAAAQSHSQQSAKRITEQDAREIGASVFSYCRKRLAETWSLDIWLGQHGGRDLLVKLNADRCQSHESEQGGAA